MHICPVCGQACDCSGDWDDASVMSEKWVARNCKCDHEGSGLDEDGLPLDDDYDDYE